MQRLLAPAIIYLNTLNYLQKFFLIGLVWLLPLLIISLAAIAQIDKRIILVYGVIAVALAIYTLAAFYESIQSTTARLRWASRRMVGGALAEPIKVDSQDELGNVAIALNEVSQSLTTLTTTTTSLRAIIDNAPDGILTLEETSAETGGQKLIRSLNAVAQQIFGYGADELIGQDVKKLIPGVDSIAPSLTSPDPKPTSAAQETRGLLRNGEPFPLEISLSRTVIEGRTVIIAVLRDISARKAEDALHAAFRDLKKRTQELEVAHTTATEANRLKSEFLSTMSHELRTPLNAIVGFTDLMLTEKPGPLTETQRMFLTRTAGNNRRLLTLINDILDLSRIEAGRMEINLASYSPREMLAHISAQNSSLFTQKNLTFKTDVDSSVPESVVGDRLRVEQIIVNLLSNAAKFTSTGEVELNAIGVDKFRWEVSVRDTGTGIAPHMQEIIFEPFRQVDGTTSRQIGGSGLGLAISRELCQIMDGTLRVESEVGRGSTFTITLPINVNQPQLSADGLQKILR